MAFSQDPNEVPKQEAASPAPFQEVPEHIAQQHLEMIKSGAKRVDGILDGMSPEQIEREKKTGRLFTNDEELLEKFRNPIKHERDTLRATLDYNGDGVFDKNDKEHDSSLERIKNTIASTNDMVKENIRGDINGATEKFTTDLESKTGLIITPETKEKIRTALLEGTNQRNPEKLKTLAKQPEKSPEEEGESKKDKKFAKGVETESLMGMIFTLLASFFGANKEEENHAKADIGGKDNKNISTAINNTRGSLERVTGNKDFQNDSKQIQRANGEYNDLVTMRPEALADAINAAKGSGLHLMANQNAPAIISSARPQQQEANAGRTT